MTDIIGEVVSDVTKKTKLETAIAGKHYRDKAGRVGAPLHLNLQDGGWNGHYNFLTHGMTDEEILAKVNRIRARHQAKAARLTAFEQLPKTITVRGRDFVIANLAIGERGTDLELVARVATADGSEENVATIRKVYGGIADIPSDGAIVTALIVAIDGWIDAQAEMSSRAVGLAALIEPIVNPKNGGGL